VRRVVHALEVRGPQKGSADGPGGTWDAGATLAVDDIWLRRNIGRDGH